MANGDLLVVDQLGATGPVAELFRQKLADPDLRMTLGQVATAQTQHVGGRLGDHDPDCPPQWANKRLTSLDDMAAGAREGRAIFSALRADVAAEYERPISRHTFMVTNSSANRMEDDVALVNTFINSDHLDELMAMDLSGYMAAGGNCAQNILDTAAAPIHREIGITGMVIETHQGWSGAGYTSMPQEGDEGYDPNDDTPPIRGDEREKLVTEPLKVLGKSMTQPAAMSIAADPHRGPWVRGHRVEATAKLARPTTRQEIEELWRHFKAPDVFTKVRQEVRALSLHDGDNWPHRYARTIHPVRMRHEPLLRRDVEPMKLTNIQPVRVKAHLIGIDPNCPNRITFEAIGDNLGIGAVDVNLLSIIYARAMGYLD